MLDVPAQGSTKRRVGRRKRIPGEPATAEKLLDASAIAFGASGFARTRLEDIAERAGVTRPTLLHHFGSKQALFEATLARAFLLLEREITRALLVPGDYDARVLAVVDALLAFNDANAGMLAVIFRGVLEEDVSVRAAVRERFLPLLDQLEATLRHAAGDRLTAAQPLRAALMSLIATQLTHSSLGAFADELWSGPAHVRVLAATMLGVEPARITDPASD